MGMPSSSNFAPRLVQLPPNTSGAEMEASCTPFGDVMVSEGFPRYALQANMGNMVAAVTTTGVAGVTAVPTTTAAAQLYNGEGLGGKSYILTHIGFNLIVIDAAQSDCHALIACLQTSANILATGVPTDATNTKRKLNCNAYGGNARISLSPTVVNNGWFSLGNSAIPAPVAAGSTFSQQEIAVEGGIVIPPGAGLGVQTLVAAAAAATQVTYTFRWIEMTLPAAV